MLVCMGQAPHFQLWHDWCVVTGTHPDDRSPATVDRFTQQVSASQRLLRALRAGTGDHFGPPPAPAWPQHLSLPVVLGRCHAIATDRGSLWLARLQAARAAYVATLIAPGDQGGLGLTRAASVELSVHDLDHYRQRLAETSNTADEAECAACAIWRWLEVVGTAALWSHWSVRQLAHTMHQREKSRRGEHVHQQPDPAPQWRHTPLLVSIDQWGYLEQHIGLHVSSLSALIASLMRLSDVRHTPGEQPMPAEQRESQELMRQRPSLPATGITAEEEATILARADELNERINAWFDAWQR